MNDVVGIAAAGDDGRPAVDHAVVDFAVGVVVGVVGR